jgi:hypothetical protein
MKLGRKVIGHIGRLGRKLVKGAAVGVGITVAVLGLKHANDVSDHSAEREKTNAESHEHLHKARATSRATVIMDGLNREHEDETRLRTSVISGAAAAGRSRVPVAPHFGRYVVKTHRKQKGETAMGRLQRINTMTNDSRRRDAVIDARMQADVGARAGIAKAEEDLRITKKKKRWKKKKKYQFPEDLAARVGK